MPRVADHSIMPADESIASSKAESNKTWRTMKNFISEWWSLKNRFTFSDPTGMIPYR
jgi:hypothetical protein